MSWSPTNPNTATALAAQSPDSVRIIWQKIVDMCAQTEDVFAQFEGSSPTSPIHVIDDLSVGAGLKFRITSRAGYYNKGKSGDNLFNVSTDYAQDIISSNEVDADFLRNASIIDQRTDEYLGTRNEIASGQAAELGKWMGRERSARAGMTYVLKGGSQNLLVSNLKTDETQLKTADGLVYNDLLYMGQALKPLGGKPCEIGTNKGVPVYKYCVLGTTPGLFSLKADSDYKLSLQTAAPREKTDENPLWTGGYMDIDGHRIHEMNPVDADGLAWAGSWFNPKAFLSTAITAGTSTFAITGGGLSPNAATTTNVEYFRFFPNFAFEFLPNDIYAPGSTAQYLLVVNPRNALVDPGKIGMYSYTTGNNGVQITISQRLGPTTAGAQVSTLGQVTWNTGVWLNKHTEVHPAGSTIVLCNQYGVPIGDTIMFGAMNMIRGYGKYRNARSQQEWEGGFQTRRFITTVFGQALRKNVNGIFPGYVRMRHALNYPELGLPVVT